MAIFRVRTTVRHFEHVPHVLVTCSRVVGGPAGAAATTQAARYLLLQDGGHVKAATPDQVRKGGPLLVASGTVPVAPGEDPRAVAGDARALVLQTAHALSFRAGEWNKRVAARKRDKRKSVGKGA